VHITKFEPCSCLQLYPGLEHYRATSRALISILDLRYGGPSL